MVLLTMTSSIVEAIVTTNEGLSRDARSPEVDGKVETDAQAEPSLDEPAVGKPISHDQILHQWKQLKENNMGSFSLESLLRGARVYMPPPPPKPEPV